MKREGSENEVVVGPAGNWYFEDVEMLVPEAGPGTMNEKNQKVLEILGMQTGMTWGLDIGEIRKRGEPFTTN